MTTQEDEISHKQPSRRKTAFRNKLLVTARRAAQNERWHPSDLITLSATLMYVSIT